jgi:hypothetical protein
MMYQVRFSFFDTFSAYERMSYSYIMNRHQLNVSRKSIEKLIAEYLRE